MRAKKILAPPKNLRGPSPDVNSVASLTMMGFQSAQNAQLLNQDATRIKLIHLFKEDAMD